jgi:hypothetical protein
MPSLKIPLEFFKLFRQKIIVIENKLGASPQTPGKCNRLATPLLEEGAVVD